jgi:serine/threonine-protein kinase
MAVGTLVYMSPEQLERKDVDHRTDIFALGCVLYEMATGQRAFAASSGVSVAAAILSSDPIPLRSLQPACPPALERIVLTALEKNRDDRWQTAQDVARQLRWLSEPSTSVEEPAVLRSPRNRRLLVGVPIAAAMGGLLVWGGMRLMPSSAARPPAARLDFAPPASIRPVPSIDVRNFALSPDGQTLCFTAVQGEAQTIVVRRLDSMAVRKIEGSENGSAPFWSSDGKWIGFSARGKLWKTQAAINGVPEFLCDVRASGAAASWVGNTILFADSPGGDHEIFRISDQGGKRVKVTSIKAGERWHGWPRLLPDGRHFLYQLTLTTSLERQLVLASLDSPASSVLLRNVSQSALLKPDSLLYVRDGKLLAQTFDPAHGTVSGEPSLIADDVSYFYPSGEAEFDGANGVIVYRTDTSTGSLIVADRKGATRLIDDRGPFDPLSLSYSPDGKRAAATVVNRATELGDIWIYDLARRVRDRFTNQQGLALAPVWSPDGRSIVYASIAGTPPNLTRRALTGSAPEALMQPGTFQFPGSFSPDGTTLYFRQYPWATPEVFRLDMRTRRAEPVVVNFPGRYPQASPDGRWLAFSSEATGANEVYLQSLTDKEMSRVRISTHGGENPQWRRDGGELFYRSPRNAVMSVVPRAAGDWSDTIETELFHAPADALRFAASPDGQSFLFIQGSPGAADSLFHVILG